MKPSASCTLPYCPCCCDCENEFRKVIELKCSGLVIYRHVKKDVNDGNIGIGTAANTDETPKDMYILENTKGSHLSSAEFVQEMSKSYIRCDRCRTIVEKIQNLLLKIPSISKYGVCGVCDRCLHTEEFCKYCQETLQKFISTKTKKTDETKERVETWLDKVNEFLKPTKKSDEVHLESKDALLPDIHRLIQAKLNKRKQSQDKDKKIAFSDKDTIKKYAPFYESKQPYDEDQRSSFPGTDDSKTKLKDVLEQRQHKGHKSTTPDEDKIDITDILSHFSNQPQDKDRMPKKDADKTKLKDFLYMIDNEKPRDTDHKPILPDKDDIMSKFKDMLSYDSEQRQDKGHRLPTPDEDKIEITDVLSHFSNQPQDKDRMPKKDADKTKLKDFLYMIDNEKPRDTDHKPILPDKDDMRSKFKDMLSYDSEQRQDKGRRLPTPDEDKIEITDILSHFSNQPQDKDRMPKKDADKTKVKDMSPFEKMAFARHVRSQKPELQDIKGQPYDDEEVLPEPRHYRDDKIDKSQLPRSLLRRHSDIPIKTKAINFEEDVASFRKHHSVESLVASIEDDNQEGFSLFFPKKMSDVARPSSVSSRQISSSELITGTMNMLLARAQEERHMKEQMKKARAEKKQIERIERKKRTHQAVEKLDEAKKRRTGSGISLQNYISSSFDKDDADKVKKSHSVPDLNEEISTKLDKEQKGATVGKKVKKDDLYGKGNLDEKKGKKRVNKDGEVISDKEEKKAKTKSTQIEKADITKEGKKTDKEPLTKESKPGGSKDSKQGGKGGKEETTKGLKKSEKESLPEDKVGGKGKITNTKETKGKEGNETMTKDYKKTDTDTTPKDFKERGKADTTKEDKKLEKEAITKDSKLGGKDEKIEITKGDKGDKGPAKDIKQETSKDLKRSGGGEQTIEGAPKTRVTKSPSPNDPTDVVTDVKCVLTINVDDESKSAGKDAGKKNDLKIDDTVMITSTDKKAEKSKAKQGKTGKEVTTEGKYIITLQVDEEGVKKRATKESKSVKEVMNNLDENEDLIKFKNIEFLPGDNDKTVNTICAQINPGKKGGTEDKKLMKGMKEIKTEGKYIMTLNVDEPGTQATKPENSDILPEKQDILRITDIKLIPDKDKEIAKIVTAVGGAAIMQPSVIKEIIHDKPSTSEGITPEAVNKFRQLKGGTQFALTLRLNQTKDIKKPKISKISEEPMVRPKDIKIMSVFTYGEDDIVKKIGGSANANAQSAKEKNRGPPDKIDKQPKPDKTVKEPPAKGKDLIAGLQDNENMTNLKDIKMISDSPQQLVFSIGLKDASTAEKEFNQKLLKPDVLFSAKVDFYDDDPDLKLQPLNDDDLIQQLVKIKKAKVPTDIIVSNKIKKSQLAEKEITTKKPMLFTIGFNDKDFERQPHKDAVPVQQDQQPGPKSGITKPVDPEATKGTIHYALSDRSFIEKGWTMLPTEKIVRKMNVYRMRPSHPEFDWFQHNKNKKFLLYDSGDPLAKFDDNGRGTWFYRNGRIALDYYDAEEINANQRIVIYSNGNPDERGRSRPYTVLAMFDYSGNGVVFDHAGKIRLKYNQTEGIILDRNIGPVSNWKWHTLNDPPVLQQVMIDTQMAHKDPRIQKLGVPQEKMSRTDNEEMLAIEFDNFIKEKSQKLKQSFKPFQIKMKALKINENFSLKVLDQATIYIIYRDGTTNLKLNIGMVLDHKEIVDTDTAELGEVSNSLERFPARTDSLVGLQKDVAHARFLAAKRSEHERRLCRPEPVASADRLAAGASRPMRTPLRAAASCSTVVNKCCKYGKKPPQCNIYYSNN